MYKTKEKGQLVWCVAECKHVLPSVVSQGARCFYYYVSFLFGPKEKKGIWFLCLHSRLPETSFVSLCTGQTRNIHHKNRVSINYLECVWSRRALYLFLLPLRMELLGLDYPCLGRQVRPSLFLCCPCLLSSTHVNLARLQQKVLATSMDEKGQRVVSGQGSKGERDNPTSLRCMIPYDVVLWIIGEVAIPMPACAPNT